MHDPMTLAFTIRAPWFSRYPSGTRYHPPLVDIWHVDPERGGSDDSCDWFGSKRPLNDREKALRDAIWQAERTFGNSPYYPGPAWDAYHEIQQASYAWRERGGFRWHPRWHVHHWRIRVWPLIHAWRFLFTPCSVCGGRIRPSHSLISDWGGDRMRHAHCDRPTWGGEAKEA